MEWGDRLVFLLIGAILGYIVRMLQDIKTEVHEVDQLVKKNGPKRNEDGFARFPIVLDVLIFVLAAMTVWSFTKGEQATDDANQALEQVQAQNAQLKAQNARIEKVASCNLEFTAKTIKALNERTTFTTEQAASNVRVLEAQLEFLRVVLFIPPVSDALRREALQQYTENVDRFVELAGKTKDKSEQYAYPTNDELLACLNAPADKEKQDDERATGTD